jgi:cold shock CspA family protein
MEEGIVKNWTGVYGYATIDEPLQRNIRLHRTNISRGVSLKFGDRISFDIGEYKGKPDARNIELVRPLLDVPEYEYVPAPAKRDYLADYVQAAKTFCPAGFIKPSGVVDETSL